MRSAIEHMRAMLHTFKGNSRLTLAWDNTCYPEWVVFPCKYWLFGNVSKYYKNGDLSLFVTVFSYLGVLKHESGC